MNAGLIKRELRTNRAGVRLRMPGYDDGPRIRELVERNSDELQRWFGITTEVLAPNGAKLYISRRRASMASGKTLAYLIEYNAIVVGSISVALDSGVLMYWLDLDFRQRGIATCALGAVIEHCRELGLQQATIHAAVENTASNRVAAKLGFSMERQIEMPEIVDEGTFLANVWVRTL